MVLNYFAGTGGGPAGIIALYLLLPFLSLNSAFTSLINLGFLGENNIIKPPMTIDPVTGLTSSEEVLLDPMEKMYRKNQRKPNKPV